MGGNSRSSKVHSHLWRQQSKRPGTEQLLGFLPCFPLGVRDKRSLTGTFLLCVCVWFSLCLSLPFVLLQWTFVCLAKGSGEYQFDFCFPFVPSVQRLSKRVWQPKHPARWRASSCFRSQFPQMAVTPLSLVSLVYLRNRFESLASTTDIVL